MREDVDCTVIVHDYVDAALAQLRRLDQMSTPDPQMPEAMFDSSRPVEEGWKAWRPIESTVGEQELDELEAKIGLRLTPAYRAFLSYKHFYDLTETGVRFTSSIVDRWQKDLESEYRGWEPARILGIGLIPIGSECFMDAGPVCLDTRRRDETSDCPVVFWDHEFVGQPKEVNPMFSSSLRMFQCLKIAAEFDDSHDDDDPAESLPVKQEALRRFLASDPEGAGGEAREYWTCWGVEP